MNYDMFILYARDDASFAKSVAKALEKINISVLYKESLPRPALGHEGFLKLAIEKGFSQALYGIIIISSAFFKLDYTEVDLDFLYEVMLMEHQVMHPVWYNVSQSDVTKWNPKFSMGVALQCPPETVDSMARKFQVKLAGSSKLQKNVLTGFYTQIQYISPKISTYRQSKSHAPGIQLPTEASFEGRLSATSSVDDKSVKSAFEKQDNPTRSIDDMTIAECFDDELKDKISKRLDVNLKGLSNWKDLAAVFRITSESELNKIRQTKLPTLSLLGLLSQLQVSVGEFKNACCKIERFDVVDCIDINLSAKISETTNS